MYTTVSYLNIKVERSKKLEKIFVWSGCCGKSENENKKKNDF